MPTRSKAALAVQHVSFEDLGNLASLLEARGYTIMSADAATDNLREAGLLDADLLVVLGGPIGVYEHEAYPFLTEEIALIRERLIAQRPTLGICLGGQLMAQALGGTVHPGALGKEIGWSLVTLTAEAHRSPLRHLDGVPVLHWHGDTFTLPPDAELLASTDKYANQAFAVGHHALAFQFHIEVTARDLERWFVGHACEIANTEGISVPQLRRDTERHATRMKLAAELCFADWLDAID